MSFSSSSPSLTLATPASKFLEPIGVRPPKIQDDRDSEKSPIPLSLRGRRLAWRLCFFFNSSNNPSPIPHPWGPEPRPSRVVKVLERPRPNVASQPCLKTQKNNEKSMPRRLPMLTCVVKQYLIDFWSQHGPPESQS